VFAALPASRRWYRRRPSLNVLDDLLVESVDKTENRPDERSLALPALGVGEELTEHLSHGEHAAASRGSGNSRNGTTPSGVSTEIGGVDLDVPREQAGSLEPR
jgi:transposase-like protein